MEPDATQGFEAPPKIVPLQRLSDWLPGQVFDNPMMSNPMIRFCAEDEYVRQDVLGNTGGTQSRAKVPGYNAFIRAGPRRSVQFNHSEVNACIVTTGGLCPGLNSVIQELVTTLSWTYQVKKVYGIRYGFKGFDVEKYPPSVLCAKDVADICQQGGSILGTSRGHFDLDQILNFLESYDIHQMFVIGGDGSHRAAEKVHDAVRERKRRTVVICIPKTIDNDLLYFDKTFGFDTAVEAADRAIECAYVESRCVENGVGLVKLMGRDSGFVARDTALSSSHVDACLIPEVPFRVHGEGGLLSWLDNHLKQFGHAVIVMAESAGQEHVPSGGLDATGHKIYDDVGRWLKQQIEANWKESGTEGKVFLIDPSYMIRSVPANTQDNIFCMELAQFAVHSAFQGFSSVSVGRIHGYFVVMPVSLVVASVKKVNPKGSLWQKLLARHAIPPTYLQMPGC